MRASEGDVAATGRGIFRLRRQVLERPTCHGVLVNRRYAAGVIDSCRPFSSQVVMKASRFTLAADEV
jgi:hypothetical protein